MKHKYRLRKAGYEEQHGSGANFSSFSLEIPDVMCDFVLRQDKYKKLEILYEPKLEKKPKAENWIAGNAEISHSCFSIIFVNSF